MKRLIKRLFKYKPPDKLRTYLGKYLSNKDLRTLIDIGAHRGDFTDEFEKHFNVEQVILIEPIKQLCEFLKTKYKSTNYLVFQNALSDSNNQAVQFYVNEYEETSSLLQFKSDISELGNVNTKLSKMQDVETRTLDSIIDETRINKIDVLKIDVQGSEAMVLKGGEKALKITKFIWIEISFKPLYTGSAVFSDIYNYLTGLGYLLLEISPGHRAPNNELLQADVLFSNTFI